MKIVSKMGRVAAAAVMSAVLGAGTAQAHSPPEKAATPHGGVAAETEHFNLELVATEGLLKLYIRDRHNRATDVRDCTGTALVWGAGATMTVDLLPAEAGVLEAQGEFSPAALQRVIVTVTAPGYESETAWFTGFGNRAH